MRYITLMNKAQGHSHSSGYRVVLIESEEGFAVSCPALPGCHSQGATKEEALENIKDAIREWLGAEADEAAKLKVTEEMVML